jgi:hypothetical protein
MRGWTWWGQDRGRRPGAARARAYGARPASAVGTMSPKPWVRTEAPDACPVPEGERVWIERWMRWCADEFGADTVRRKVALPLPGFVPADFTDAQEQTGELLRRVGAVMGADLSRVAVTLVEPRARDTGGWHPVGGYYRVLGRELIELDRSEAVRSAVFAAIIAHELGHARLIGEQRLPLAGDGPRPGPAGPDAGRAGNAEEKLTDLLTVFLGMGVFTADSAHHHVRTVGYSIAPVGDLTDHMLTGRRDEPSFRVGYLSVREFGHALAYYARLRDETAPPWARHLSGEVLSAFTRGLAYLTRRQE